MAGVDPLRRSHNPWVIGGIAVLGIGALVGLAFLVSSLLASNRGDLDLAWLPPESEIIVRIEMADLWNAPLLEPVRRHPLVAMFLGMGAGQFGLGIDDIQSVTFGASGVSDAVRQREAAALDLANLSNGDAIVVIRTKKAIPIDKVTAGAEKQQHAGTTCYKVAQEDGPPILAFFPAARTAVLGPEQSIQAAIARGESAPERPELAFADLDQHLVFIMVPQSPAVWSQAAEQQGGGHDGDDALPPELAAKLRGISFGLTLTEGADFQLRMDCADAAAAERIQAELEQKLGEGRAAFGMVPAAAEPVQEEARQLVEQMLNEAQVTRSESTVELTAALPRGTKDVLARAMDSMNPFALGGDGESGFDLEGFEGFKPSGEIPVAPEAVSVEEFNESWQMDLDVEDEPAGAVLASLADGLSLELETGSDADDALDTPVSLSLENVSRFAAVEAVCTAAGLLAEYSAEGGVKLAPGARSNPVAFAGPFLIEVDSFDVFEPYASGHLKLRVIAAGLPPNAMYALRKTQQDVFHVESVTGPDGEDLMNRDEGVGTYISNPDRPEVFVRTEAINLKNLLRRVDRLGSIRGRVQLVLPTATEHIRLTDLSAGATASAGDVEVRVRSAVLADDSSMLDFSYQGRAPGGVVFVPFDAAGEPLPVSSVFGGSVGDEGQSSITVDGRPATFAVTIVTAREELEYEFNLENIPVPKAAQRPEELPPLEFAGHSAPVSVESAALDRNQTPPRVMVRVTNHSNKDIRRLDFQLDYLDSQGRKLDDWQASYAGEASFGDSAPPLAVTRSGQARFELVAFSLPDEASRVEPRLRRVICADGTIWKAPGE